MVVHPSSHRVSRVRRYSGYPLPVFSFAYGTLTLCGRLSHAVLLVILMVSPLGLQEYEAYAKTASDRWFHELFELLDHATPEELETVRKAFAIFSNWHSEKRAESREEQEDLVRIE